MDGPTWKSGPRVDRIVLPPGWPRPECGPRNESSTSMNRTRLSSSIRMFVGSRSIGIHVVGTSADMTRAHCRRAMSADGDSPSSSLAQVAAASRSRAANSGGGPVVRTRCWIRASVSAARCPSPPDRLHMRPSATKPFRQVAARMPAFARTTGATAASACVTAPGRALSCQAFELDPPVRTVRAEHHFMRADAVRRQRQDRRSHCFFDPVSDCVRPREIAKRSLD